MTQESSRVPERTVHNPEGLAAPTGAPDTPFYSWVVRRGSMVFLSGMSPYDKDKNLIGETLLDQTRQALSNMKTAMESIGGTMADVCSITVYVTRDDLQADVYPEVNPACHEFFGASPPARHVLAIRALPRPTELVMVAGTAVLGQMDS